MSMHGIAQYLKVNGALKGDLGDQQWFSVPQKDFKLRYQLCRSESDSSEMFEVRSDNRARNGFMSRFML